jgi:hypothetical protein
VQKRFGGCIDAPSATSRCVAILSVFGRFLSGDTSDQDFSRPGAGLQQQTHAFRQRLRLHRGYQRFGADDRLELAAVNGDAGLREEAHHAAQRNKPRAYLVDGRAIVLAEIGNRLVIWSQTPRQPHHLDVAQSLALKPAARLDPIEIAVNVAPPSGRRLRTNRRV